LRGARRKVFLVKLRTSLTVSVIAILALTGLSSAEGEGTAGAQFLRIGVGARALGMGEAYCAVSDDALSIHWNPAGLSQSTSGQVTFAHLEWFEGIRYEFLGYTRPIGERASIGAAYYLLHTGDIRRTLEDAWGQYAGEDGTFAARDQALAVSYSHRMNEVLSIGGNAKLIRQDNANETASGFAFDLAGTYETPLEGLTIGLNLQNMGREIGFLREKDPLPFNVKVGGAYRLSGNPLIVALDVNSPSDGDLVYNAGLEYWVRNLIALRTGYNSKIRGNDLNSSDLADGIAMGLGIEIKSLQFDAAYVPYGDLGHTFSASLLIRLGNQSNP
jgi:hypothetical protein